MFYLKLTDMNIFITQNWILNRYFWVFNRSAQCQIDIDYDINNYSTALGYYLNDTTSLYVNYGKTEVDTPFFETDATNYTIGGRSFFKFDGEQGLMVDASFSHAKYEGTYKELYTIAGLPTKAGLSTKDSSNAISINADYYINNAWSVGANYSRNSEAKTNVYGLQTAYFWRLSDSMSLQAFANKALKPSNDGFGIGLSLLGRF